MYGLSLVCMPHRGDALAEGGARRRIGGEAVDAARGIFHGVEGQRAHGRCRRPARSGRPTKPTCKPRDIGQMRGLVVGRALHLLQRDLRQARAATESPVRTTGRPPG